MHAVKGMRMDYPIQSPLQLGTHLRALRRAHGLSQSRLGEMLGVGQSRVARIERDPGAMSVDQFMRLLGALQVALVLRAPAGGAAQANDDGDW
jgi:HTH-type transcriptional regulator/antitoxin HipB